jgi:hypothetical protein
MRDWSIEKLKELTPYIRVEEKNGRFTLYWGERKLLTSLSSRELLDLTLLLENIKKEVIQ